MYQNTRDRLFYQTRQQHGPALNGRAPCGASPRNPFLILCDIDAAQERRALAAQRGPQVPTGGCPTPALSNKRGLKSLMCSAMRVASSLSPPRFRPRLKIKTGEMLVIRVETLRASGQLESEDRDDRAER